jgi:hypothetical protein
LTMFSSTSPFSSLTCGGIHSEKRKGRKSQFLFMAQLLRKTNLAEIFSEARSGTIAHKTKKNYGSHPMFLSRWEARINLLSHPRKICCLL